jgi:hypothetical protein
MVSLNTAISASTLSRIDKLAMDLHDINPDDARRIREGAGLIIVAGDDVRTSYGLQVALLTAINLGAKCFSNHVQVKASRATWDGPCLVRLSVEESLGAAIRALGGTPLNDDSLLERRHLILGEAAAPDHAVRITYDGWIVAVGPAADQPRLQERPFCPLASVAAAAIGVGEMFAVMTRVNLKAARQKIQFSLWNPTQGTDVPGAEGASVNEFPEKIALFGLGHLGQAYLWSIASLRFENPSDVTLWLCDDDVVEEPNVETGALLHPNPKLILKTRMAASWLEDRQFTTRLLERRVDTLFHRTADEPRVALTGFDDNHARQWLSSAGFGLVLDTGLGGEAGNFDSIAFRAWPNPRAAEELWPSDEPASFGDEVGDKLEAPECGRVLVNQVAIAVPFVGAIASCVVLGELLKRIGRGPCFHEMRLRVCSLASVSPTGAEVSDVPLMRGVRMGPLRVA